MGGRARSLVRLLAVEASPGREAIPIPNRTHIELVEAIRGRDPDAAERAMRDHCERSLLLQQRRALGMMAC